MKLSILTAVAAIAFAIHGQAEEPKELKAPKVRTVRSAIVNILIPNSKLPMGVVRVGERGLIAAFIDGNDIQPGCAGYLVRSTDLGKTWSKPFLTVKSDLLNVGTAIAIASLPDGDLLLTEMVETYLSDDQTWDAVFKGHTTEFRLKRSSDGGKTFVDDGVLPLPKKCSAGIMGTVTALSNGDLIMPGFQYPGVSPREEGFQYGSGFFRSRDGGKTWGRMEIAFKDPIAGRENPLGFNEAAYFLNKEGTVIAYARIDSEGKETALDVGNQKAVWAIEGNNLWVVESSDDGTTWSEPKETNIGGLFPAIARLADDRYLMVCGNRHSNPSRTTYYYSSRDGYDFQFAGSAPYSRTNGVADGNNGGSHSLVVIDEKHAYMTYYASDPKLGTANNTYIEGVLLKVD